MKQRKSVTIRLSVNDMTGNDNIRLTKQQMNKIKKRLNRKEQELI